MFDLLKILNALVVLVVISLHLQQQQVQQKGCEGFLQQHNDPATKKRWEPGILTLNSKRFLVCTPRTSSQITVNLKKTENMLQTYFVLSYSSV